MSDTQWPRFEVFVQEREGRPHQNVGSVHAPDAEMALQNARDVFVRRPDCLSLWVVPAATILARTAEQLAAEPLEDDSRAGAAEVPYLVFQKEGQRRAMTFVRHAGEVRASSPAQALHRALASFASPAIFVWWVCPAGAVVRSGGEDVASMFAPANDKSYRLPHEYRVVSLMHDIKAGPAEGDDLQLE
jgi:ring-1,2-phenylacetyl-CoA epoxidase subunit PaaB